MRFELGISLIFLSFLELASCERILFLFPIASKSHRNVFDPLINALADRGHDMTVVTPYPTKELHINVEEIVPLPGEHFVLSQFQDPFEMRKSGKLAIVAVNMDTVFEGCHKVYQSSAFQHVISQKYDLVIMSGFMNTCFDGVLSKIGAPHILITTMAAPTFITEFTGNYLPSSFVPNPFLSQTDRMNFRQRLFNWAGDTLMGVGFEIFYRRKNEALYRQYLGEDTPGITAIDKNVSLVFMNSHFSMNYPRPNLPDNVEVGGMHCRPAQPLPKDLEDFVSGAKHGFIYFSFGSIVQAKNMPEEYRRIFVKVFGKLKQRVLWKWEAEEMPNLPSNVKLSAWLPQQDILGHPNIKLFITHGGLLSTQEAVYHGAPLLGIPMFGDQDLNMKQAEAAGYAIKFEILDLTEELLEEKLNLVLSEPSYTSRAKELSAVFRDQPETPVERAVYWSEYVLRHKGAHHLRSAARELNYFQIHSMDVLGFLLLVFLITLRLIKLACVRFGKCLMGLTRKKAVSKKSFEKKTK